LNELSLTSLVISTRAMSPSPHSLAGVAARRPAPAKLNYGGSRPPQNQGRRRVDHGPQPRSTAAPWASSLAAVRAGSRSTAARARNFIPEIPSTEGVLPHHGGPFGRPLAEPAARLGRSQEVTAGGVCRLSPLVSHIRESEPSNSVHNEHVPSARKKEHNLPQAIRRGPIFNPMSPQRPFAAPNRRAPREPRSGAVARQTKGRRPLPTLWGASQ